MRLITDADIDAQLRRALGRRFFSMRSPLAFALVIVLSVVQMWIQRDSPWIVAVYGGSVIGSTLVFGYLFFKLGYLVGASDMVNYIDNWEHEQ